MTADEIRALINEAFAGIPRPEAFTSGCICDECLMIEDAFQEQGSELPDGLAWELPLLSPGAIRYLMPKFVHACLSETEDNDLPGNFVNMLGTSVSQSDPPDYLPFACEFDHRQCASVLEFLRFIRSNWFDEFEPVPREIMRGIRNWEHFTACAAETRR